MKSHPQRPRSPHIRKYEGKVIDYNGVGAWSAAGIRARYELHAIRYGVKHPAHLVPITHREGDRTWIYSLIEALYPLVEAGDVAAIEVGIPLIEEDEFFVFGRILKSNMARSLRCAPLSPDQQQRLRHRIVGMMLAGEVPHEFREYKKLLRKVGVADLWPALELGVDRSNPYVMRHYEYLQSYAR